jgi:hypothetical protein
VGLGAYAVYVGVAFVVTLAALATWATLRGHLSIYFNRTELIGEALRAEMARSLTIIRAELDGAVAKAEAAAVNAKRIGEGVIAAAKPIEEALRHLSSRISAMELRTDASDRLHAQHKSSAERLQSSLENNAHATGEMDVRLNEVQRQLAAPPDQLFDETMREVTLNHAESNSIVPGIDGRLREIDERFAKLSDRGMSPMLITGALLGQMKLTSRRPPRPPSCSVSTRPSRRCSTKCPIVARRCRRPIR